MSPANAFVTADGLSLAFEDTGAGRPVIFQHGLGGDRRQAAEAFGMPAGARRITLECRGQGASPLGAPHLLSLARFAGDIEQLSAALGLDAPVVGGISMGAALALRLAAKGALRPRALILARPAWLFDPAPPNMAVYAEVGQLLLRHPPVIARAMFLEGPSAGMLSEEAPDNLASLAGFFDRPDAGAFGELLVRIAGDGLGVSEADARRIECPVLVLGHARDVVHPLSHARRLAGVLPRAQFREITPKATDRDRYVAEFREAVADFIGRVA